MDIDPRKIEGVAAGLAQAATLALAGCGGPDYVGDPEKAMTVGPQGGPAVPLGGKGFAEILVEPAPGSGKKASRMVLAVYFVGPDLRTALAPTPTEASIALTIRGGDPKAIVLAPKPDPSKPCGSARFASEPGPFGEDEVVGELTATVDGETFTRPFSVR